MTIPASGAFTSEQVRAEWGGSYPMTSAQVAAWAGLSGVWTSDQLRGKSSFSATFTVGNEQDVTAGSPVSGNRRRYRLLTSSVSGGSGNYTYSWTATETNYSGFLGTPTTSSIQWSQSYNINEFAGEPFFETAQITLTVTDTTTGQVASSTKTVTIGNP